MTLKECGQTILVTGAARSGKSEWAESLAIETGKSVIYIATAQRDASDQEWQQRIEKHRRRRPSDWQTWQVPIALTTAINKAKASNCLLIDSLGTWVANLLAQDTAAWENTTAELLTSLNDSHDVIFVAEETGWGVVPAYESGRRFRDRLGHLSRQIGAIADRVYLVTGGYALNLTVLGHPLKHSE